MKKRFQRRSRSVEINQDGQDSFLDIVSNIVGILIILVMIAGVQVRSIQPENLEASSRNALDSQNATSSEIAEILRKKEYLRLAEEFENAKSDVSAIKSDVEESNAQLLLVRQEADGAAVEFDNLVENITRLEAAVELESRNLDASEKQSFDFNQKINELNQESESLERTKNSLLLARPKATVLENIPTPLSKKVEGHEGYFRLKNDRISHVPMNVFVEKVRGFFQTYRDLEQTQIDQTIGPIEQYSFRFLASLHKKRDQNGISFVYSFDYGECVPLNDSVGETFQEAIAADSAFRRKLSLYLKDSSTITLFVYSDSFGLLREMKRLLLENGYSVAVRPLPDGRPIAVSPDGTDSVAY